MEDSCRTFSLKSADFEMEILGHRERSKKKKE